MKSKKIIVSIVVCLVIAVIAVFVVPSSSSYLSEVTISGEKKKGYSFYKSISISNKFFFRIIDIYHFVLPLHFNN